MPATTPRLPKRSIARLDAKFSKVSPIMREKTYFLPSRPLKMSPFAKCSILHDDWLCNAVGVIIASLETETYFFVFVLSVFHATLGFPCRSDKFLTHSALFAELAENIIVAGLNTSMYSSLNLPNKRAFELWRWSWTSTATRWFTSSPRQGVGACYSIWKRTFDYKCDMDRLFQYSRVICLVLEHRSEDDAGRILASV